MFFLKLLFLPFRGLWLIFWGVLTSLPIWIVVALCYLNVWAPWMLEFFTKKTTGFYCPSISTDINPLKGQFLLKDFSIINPKQYATSDFLRINKLEVQSSVTHWFSSYRHYYKMELDIQKLTWVLNSFTDNNIQTLIESFLPTKVVENKPAITPESTEVAKGINSTPSNTKTLQKVPEGKKQKGFFIKQLSLKFNGTISIQDYSSGILRAKDYPISYEKTFNNVAYKLTEGEKLAIGETEYSSYDDVLKEVSKTFKEGYGFSFLVNTILTSLNKYPSLSPLVQKLF